ncbi:Branchpoint-bridging protein [Caenorhabditis elegans]|uniref:Branchpoint-bridging protein n=1 Tax=Caenorhabditis elegans TaxID=6239 RepID=Q20422_CAEEL|nr:Branchpoint-bridging protein [Caenorhabditis elegans]CAB01503.2 Branchpoint-bridging protein [Caenorhabditis elegans]|eukprot:NP_506141.2 Uncharacterized protein CELE_F45D3.2 [Caenorhabditis elegans]
MDQLTSQLGSAELQALIAALPHDLTLNPVTSKPSSASSSDLSASTSTSSCIFPPINDMTALSMLSLGAYPGLFTGFPLLSTLPYLNLPPHSTIESLGLINSALYQQQKDVQAAMNSPVNQFTAGLAADGRPRAFSSAATLQHGKDQEKRRKRTRKMEPSLPITTSTITCSSNSSPSSSSITTSVLRTLVEDDDADVHPNKVRPIQVTKEEEDLVRRKTQELLKSMPLQKLEPEVSASGPLRRLIRDEDLPDEVGPDSPFRHYPKYQVHNRSPVHN